MIKKIISGLLIVTMMITSVDLTVFAEEDIQTDCIVAEEDTAVLGDETGDEINDETYDEVEPLGAVKPNQDERFPATIQPVSDRKDFKEFKAIHNRKELEAIVNNTSGKYYLANDIDLAGKDWTPIGYTKDNKGENLTDFRGILDGQGHSIKNMTMNPSERYAKYYPNGVGLFASIGDNYGYSPGKSIGTYAVQNLILEDVSINASGDLSGVSAVAGRLNSLDENSSVLFDNIVVTGSVSGPGYVGAIIGNAGSDKCTISNCSNYASVTSANGLAGGIVCYTDGPIENCVNHGTVNGHGGIAAGTQSDISGCKNYGDISVSYQSDNTYVPDYDMHYSFGGIVGAMNYYSDDHSYRSITDCHNYGNIHVSDSNQSAVVGGVAGKTSGIVFENCSNDGSVLWEYTGQYDITSTGLFSGGIVGEAENNGFEHDLLNNCNNNGSVFGRVSGGVAGRALGFVKGCTNSGTVTNGGGIIGECEAYNDRYTIESCENYGRIEGNFGSGIVFAGNQTSVSKCKNYGEIDITIIEDSSSAGLTGGIAGSCGDISECLNIGEITVQNKNMNSYYVSVGGIAGDVSGEALNCINYGSIYSNCNTGGIAGSSNHTRKCRNEGSLSVICDDSKGADCGGIVAAGSSDFVVEECSNYADIDIDVHVNHTWRLSTTVVSQLSPPEPMAGGIVGKNGVIKNSYNSGNIHIKNSSLGTEKYPDSEGGIENHMFGAIAGGIAGYAAGIENSYNTGNVSVEASSGYIYSGGVIGYGGDTRCIDYIMGEREEAEEWAVSSVKGTVSLSNNITAFYSDPVVQEQKGQTAANAIGNSLSINNGKNMWRSDGIDQESSYDYSLEMIVHYGTSAEPDAFYKQTTYEKLEWDFENVWMNPGEGGLPVLIWENFNYGPKIRFNDGSEELRILRFTNPDIKYKETKISDGRFNYLVTIPGDSVFLQPVVEEGAECRMYSDSAHKEYIDNPYLGLTYKNNIFFAVITKGEKITYCTINIVKEEVKPQAVMPYECRSVYIRYPGKSREESVKVKWGGKLFEESSLTPNNDLALVSASISSMVETSAFDYPTSEEILRIQENFHGLGFEYDNIAIGNYAFREIDGFKMRNLGIDDLNVLGSYAYAIASESIDVNGELNNVIVIAARGSTTTGEFAGDLSTNNKYRDFFGYYIYDNAYDFYESIVGGLWLYLEDHKLTLSDGSKVTFDQYINGDYDSKLNLKILLTGHSLGGASINLVGYYLNEFAKYSGRDTKGVFDRDDIYLYSFGAINSIAEGNIWKPSTLLNGYPVSAGYENFHNIYNFYDTFGPKGHGSLATERWFYHLGSGYGKFGHLDLFEKKYDVNHNMYNYIDAVENKLVDYYYTYKKDIWKQEHLYACPVDIDVYKNDILVGRVKDNIVDESSTTIPMYVDEDEVKHILLSGEDKYRIEITATDEGTMKAFINDINGGTMYKAIDDIKLEKGKVFEVPVDVGQEADEEKLLILDTTGIPVKEVLEDGDEVKYFPYDDVLESDIPADGVIPDGIWLGGVKDLAYTGKKLTQDFRVYDGTTLLTVNKDYKVAYKNNQKQYTIADPGNLAANDKKKAPQISITMKGNYSGKETVYFSINSTGTNPEAVKTEPYSIAGDKVTITDTSGNTALSAAYDKSGAKPSLRILYEDTILKEGRDYSLKYAGNTKYPATKASVTITGMGKFNGKKTVPFAITQRSFSTAAGITVVASDKAEGKKAGQYLTTVKVFDSEGKLLKAGTDYEKNIVYMKDGAELTKTDFPKAGDVITVRVTGKGGYTNSYIETKYNIVPTGQVNDISKATFKIKTQLYNKGRAVTITSQDMFDQAFIGKGKTPLTLSTDGGVTGDFMVVPGSYVKNTGKGTAKVTFMGINGNTGTKTVSFGIGTRSLKDFWKGLIN